MAVPGAEQKGFPMLRAFRLLWLHCILRTPLVSLLSSAEYHGDRYILPHLVYKVVGIEPKGLQMLDKH